MTRSFEEISSPSQCDLSPTGATDSGAAVSEWSDFDQRHDNLALRNSLNESLPLTAWCERLFKLEGSAPYRDVVDLDVHAIGARSKSSRTQIVYILTAINSEV